MPLFIAPLVRVFAAAGQGLGRAFWKLGQLAAHATPSLSVIGHTLKRVFLWLPFSVVFVTGLLVWVLLAVLIGLAKVILFIGARLGFRSLPAISRQLDIVLYEGWRLLTVRLYRSLRVR